MALRARIYAYNRHLSFDVAFICSTLTHCGICDMSVWRLKGEVSYEHQRVWHWKWFSYQSSYVLQRLRLCRASDTVFRREIDSQLQWGYGTCYGDSFPAAKECIHGSVCAYVCVWLGSFVTTSSGEGIVALYAVPNPFLLNKICLNQN